MLLLGILFLTMYMPHYVVTICPVGHTEVDSTCVDIDECMLSNGGCQEECRNTIGSYYCSCTDQSQIIDHNNNCTARSSECLTRCVYSDVSINCNIFLLNSLTWPTLLGNQCFKVNSPVAATLYLRIYPASIGSVLTVNIDLQSSFYELRLQTLFVLDCSLLGNDKVGLSSGGVLFTGVRFLTVIGCFEQSSALNFTKYFPSVTYVYFHGVITESSSLVGFWNSFRNLTDIRLTQNRLDTLEANMFQNLSNIQTLNLDGNFISSLQNDTFSHLSSLRRIQMSFNNLMTIHDYQFTRLRSLEIIALRSNSLTSLPNTAFEQCPMLTSIDLNGNPLNCDCDLAWISAVNLLYSIFFASTTCSSTGLSINNALNYVNCPADKQECFNSSIMCEYGCVNTPDSFYCICPEGYGLSDNLVDCDIDECDSDVCNQTCTNTIGSYYCGCLDGFQLNSDNRSCDDIDECGTNNNICLQTCTNTIGSYYCGCILGFRLNSDNRSCDDVNECDEGSAACMTGCTNTIGSYQCRCDVENPSFCCPVNQSYCPDLGCCLDNVHSCPPTFPVYIASLTVSVGGGSNSPLVLTARSFPTTVLCSINPVILLDYGQGFIEICEDDWGNCETVYSSHPTNFIYTTIVHSDSISFARCRYLSLTGMTVERNFIVTPHPTDSLILSQFSANNIISLLAWNVYGNCSLNCPPLNITIYFQSHPGVNLQDLAPFEISCSVYNSLHWFSYSYYKLDIDFPDYSLFGEDYSIQIENPTFGSITRAVSIPFPSSSYCSRDFQYGLFWGVTSVGVTVRHNCSSLIPKGGGELSRTCLENGDWGDVISECVFTHQYSNVFRAVLLFSLQQYLSPSTNSLCPYPHALAEYVLTLLDAPVMSAVRGEFTDSIVVSGSSREGLIELFDNLTAVNCYSQYWVSEIVMNTSFCQCSNAMEIDRVFVCTEHACNCTARSCACSRGFAGNGVYCSPDTDGDNLPATDLPCSQPSCRMDNCHRHFNPSQEDCNGDGVGDACQELCSTETDHVFGLKWPCSLSGYTATTVCNGTDQQATRVCVGDRLWSVKINTRNCLSPSYDGLTSLSRQDGLRELSVLIDEELPAYSGDIDISMSILLDNLDRTEEGTELYYTLSVVDALIDRRVIDILSQTESVYPVVEAIISLLDRHGINALSQNKTVRYTNFTNIHFEARNIENAEKPITLGAASLPFETEDGVNTVQVAVPVDQADPESVGVSFYVLRNIGSILSRYSNDISIGEVPINHFTHSSTGIVSPVVSVQILKGGRKITEFNNEAVNITIPFKVSVPANSYRKLSCVFLPLESDQVDSVGYSTWMDGRADTSSSNDSVIQCSSTHLTSFAVLAAFNSLDQQNAPLTIVSYTGVGVSIISLSLCVFIYLVFGHKLLKNIQHYTYFNLIMSLLFLFILFSVGLELPYLHDFLACKIASGFLQYLLLCVFAWMLLIGIVILILMLSPFHQFTLLFGVVATVLCWSIPALYVGSYSYFAHESFLTPTKLVLNATRRSPGYCWIQSRDGMGYAHYHNLFILIPILCVILINLAVFLVVIVKAIKVYRDGKSFRKLERAQKLSLRLLRLFIVLTPLLGFIWIVGVLALDPVSAFAWLFTILGSFQGLFILVFVVLLRKDIRDAIIGRFGSIYRRITSLTGQESKLTR